jgi:hypothetical protein
LVEEVDRSRRMPQLAVAARTGVSSTGPGLVCGAESFASAGSCWLRSRGRRVLPGAAAVVFERLRRTRFHPLILRLYLNVSFANFVTACAIDASSGCVTGYCRSHLLGRPCAGFCTRCREDRGAGGAGTPLARLHFPSALVVASRACVSRLPARDTAVPLRHFARPRAFFAGPGMIVVDSERCPCGFGR